MFRKVLFPVDFSEGFYKAAENFGKKNHIDLKEVILLHVIDEGRLEEMMSGYSFFYKGTERALKEIKHKLEKEVMDKLEELQSKIHKSFKVDKTKIMIRFGTPWEEIIKVSEEENVSLIVMPSHGRMSFSYEILGSTTVRVLRKATKPLLIIKSLQD